MHTLKILIGRNLLLKIKFISVKNGKENLHVTVEECYQALKPKRDEFSVSKQSNIPTYTLFKL